MFTLNFRVALMPL